MSKGLEALERIQYNYVRVFKARECGKKQLVHDLITIKKELKALEIIKEKQVNVEIFREVIKQFTLNPNKEISLWQITEKEEHKKEKFITELDLYNRTCIYGLSHLNQEEYDLLKEVLL